MKTIYALSVILILPLFSWGQNLPNLPPSIKWQKINSPHFQIIYPKGLENQAQKTTNILEHIYTPASTSMGAKPRRFPVVLHHQYALSNGSVGIAPYKSDFFMYEPQDYKNLGNDRWLEHLAAHEYRHMVQFEKSITPFNKFIYFLSGEYGIGISAAGGAPTWFFEGDAVGIETAMGYSGRGRIPSFSMGFKANLLEKGGFNYHKQYLKSFRDFVPNHYLTGYLMTTYLKNEYGADIMGKIVGRSFRAPFLPFSFSMAMKKETGKHLIETYEEMLDQQKQLYVKEMELLQPEDYLAIAHEQNKNFTNYSYPTEINGNDILTVKAGFSDIPAFVTIDDSGHEHKLFELGLWNDAGRLSINDSVVVWTEQGLDTRWQRITYSDIKKYNYITEKRFSVTSKTKYSSPDISRNGRQIIAINQSITGLQSLHLINAQSGTLIKAFSNESNDFYSMPRFDESQANVVVLKHIKNGKQVILKNIESETEQILYAASDENIGHPLVSGEWLLFTSDKSGIDNVYAFHLNEKKTYQVTNTKYGAFNPYVTQGGDLLFNNYTVDGHEICRISMNRADWKVATDLKPIDFPSKMIESEGQQDILYNYPDSTFQSSKYRKGLRSFRPHTWLLNTTTKNIVSAQVYSKDVLQTTSATLGSSYNYREKIWRTSANISYQALYPIIDFTANVGKRSMNIADTNSDIHTIIWNENEYSLGLTIPVYLTNSKYFRSASFSANVHYSEVSNFDSPVQLTMPPQDESLHALTYRATFSRLLRQSKLDLNSKWGQTVALNYKHTPIGGDLSGRLFSLGSNLFFPGFFPHHSLHLSASAQHSNHDNYSFASPIAFTKGYDALVFTNYLNLSFNYKLPIARMDWHLGPLVNLQRIYSNLFYDFGKGKNAGTSVQNLKSVGIETHFNFNILRLLPLFDVGIRYSYLPQTKKFVPQIIIGTISL